MNFNKQETIGKTPLLSLILQLVGTAEEKVEVNICVLFWGKLEVTGIARGYLLPFSFLCILSSFILISLNPHRNMITLIVSVLYMFIFFMFTFSCVHRTIVLSYCSVLPCQQRTVSLLLVSKVNKQRLQFYSILSTIKRKKLGKVILYIPARLFVQLVCYQLIYLQSHILIY